jgi:hypothetical protein
MREMSGVLPRSLRRAIFCGAFVLLGNGFFVPLEAHAQAPDRPLSPPPEHDTVRLSTKPETPAPPALPPEEIIKRFTAKEDEFQATRPQYGYRKTIRIDEFGPDGKVSGQFVLVTELTRTSNGQIINKVIEKPQSTLHYFTLETEDTKDLDRIPPFPITSGQLANYNLKYLGEEKVDEVDCYIFKVSPKSVDRAHAYLDGILWVDDKYLEVVRTYGKWVNELGEVRPVQALPFTIFDTYRENVDGKYWFPNYERADGIMELKDANVPLRLTIKWSDFKPLPAAAPATAPVSPSMPPAKSETPVKPPPSPG